MVTSRVIGGVVRTRSPAAMLTTAGHEPGLAHAGAETVKSSEVLP